MNKNCIGKQCKENSSSKSHFTCTFTRVTPGKYRSLYDKLCNNNLPDHYLRRPRTKIRNFYNNNFFLIKENLLWFSTVFRAHFKTVSSICSIIINCPTNPVFFILQILFDFDRKNRLKFKYFFHLWKNIFGMKNSKKKKNFCLLQKNVRS